MHTYFASPERCNEEELRKQVDIVSRNPVIDGLLKFTSGLLAVLDSHRQILAVNDSMLQMLGIENASNALGLRPGEAICCIHADEEPGGCGTAKSCSTCGAAIAIVATLAEEIPSERTCAATIKRRGEEIDVYFQVRCVPIKYEGYLFLLLFMQDITNYQRWAALERAFFHDILNFVSGLVGVAELIALEGTDPYLLKALREQAWQLKNEIDVQRVLASTKGQEYELSLQEVTANQVVTGIRNVFANHPVAAGKSLKISEPIPKLTLFTDYSLLLRVLINMLTNAFEATDGGGAVRFWIDGDGDAVSFFVWNKEAIPGNVKQRIFQRHFSTKNGTGRGIGTFSMKLLGEEFLRGNVGFTTSDEEGTVFRFTVASSQTCDA